MLAAATLSILFGCFQVHKIFEVKLSSTYIDEEQMDLASNDAQKKEKRVENKMIEISELIQDGASTFLK